METRPERKLFLEYFWVRTKSPEKEKKGLSNGFEYMRRVRIEVPGEQCVDKVMHKVRKIIGTVEIVSKFAPEENHTYTLPEFTGDTLFQVQEFVNVECQLNTDSCPIRSDYTREVAEIAEKLTDVIGELLNEAPQPYVLNLGYINEAGDSATFYYINSDHVTRPFGLQNINAKIVETLQPFLAQIRNPKSCRGAELIKVIIITGNKLVNLAELEMVTRRS